MKKKLNLMMLSNSYIKKPSSVFSFLPFNIYKSNGVIKISNFDLQKHANITISKTYYVDRSSGSDLNDGLTPETALNRITSALSKSDVDRVYVKSGFYERGYGIDANSPARNIEIIGYGGDVTVSQMIPGLSWSAEDTHYKASYENSIVNVVDFSALNLLGDGVVLTKVANVASVDSTAGSWYYDADADLIYVRTSDSREPDSNIHCYYSGYNLLINDAVKYYVEGIDFEGGTTICYGASTSSDAKLYCKGCKFKYPAIGSNAFDIDGMGEIIIQNCVARVYVGNDGFNYHALSGNVPNVIEIDCDSTAGTPKSIGSNQASTVHEGINIIRVNGKYYDTGGQAVADIGAAQVWNLGCELSHGTTVGYYLGNVGANAWFDTCNIHSNTTFGIQTETGTTVYLRNTINGETNKNDGTITTY